MKAFNLLFTFLLLLTYTIGYGQLQTETPEEISNQVIVRMQKNQNPGNLGRLVPDYFELEVEEILSKHSDIWLLKFNDEKTNVREVVKHLYEINSVFHAQPNRVVQLRETVPNDPQYGQQWHHQNIDSELAWDITTGGSTPNGTDIVIALIESADIINHDDLKDNRWINTAEIPNNGIDDDGNGYVDDYNGWNVSTNNDNIGTGSHGTNCAGMMGAKGNNALGVTGINWDIKIMNIAGHDSPFTESNIVSAYEYALQARLKWNATGGQEGSFVVATSASWGIDYGDPNDYPIWCGFYEDMGQAGILNAGATSNSNLNIDQTGDVPSACPSDYMISVTATNSSDVIDFAGYGQNTINLGAPGSSVRTTAQNNGYTTTLGTSFATPLTAGLIGLMYSVPCPNLEAMAMSDPQGTANLVRQALFDGVDQNSYLMTRTTTGGRINAKNSIDLLMDAVCSSCGIPTNVTITSINENSADIAYDGVTDAASYTISIQVAGSDNWTSYTTTGTTFSFTGLTSCTEYEYYITTTCQDQEISNPTVSQFFTTTGCGNCIDLPYCETTANNPSTVFKVTEPTNVEDSYNYVPTTNFGGSVTDGYKYGELVLVNDGSASPDEGCNTLINTAEINGNIAVVKRGTCNFTVKAMNAQNAGATAVIVINNVGTSPIDMGGSNNNITIPAIMISQADGNALLASINNQDQPKAILGNQNEWIASFEIDGTVFNTGDNDGYYEHGTPTTLVAGQTYPFILTPAFDGQALPEYTRIWIDLNQDGVFDASEIVFDQNSPSTTAVSDNFTIPSSTTLGSTRMRVQMAYQGDASSTLPDVCGNFLSGEVEDYCIKVISANTCEMEVASTVTQPDCSQLNNGKIELSVTGGIPDYTYLWNNGATTSAINNLSANNYSVLITDDSGCETTATFSLNYTRELEISSSIVAPSCSNTNDGEIAVNVTGGNNYTYTWSNGESTPTINALTPGNYNVIVTDELGCTATESYSLNAQNIPAPVVNFTSNSSYLVTDFNNTTSNATSYFWDFGDGQTSTDANPTHTFPATGNYNVCLTAYGTCDTITDCKSITVVENSSGIEEEEFQNYVVIYPNPAKEKITIKKESLLVESIVVYNTNGQVIHTSKLKDENTILKVKNWSAGSYTIQLLNISGEVVARQKLNIIK